MLALDTNVIIRLLTVDDPSQAAKARALVENEEVFVCTTVLLEVEWVLRSLYELPSIDIFRVLRDFAGLPNVVVEDEPSLRQALDWADDGLDFADALHLATSRHCEAFATFDRGMVKTARRLRAGDVRLV